LGKNQSKWRKKGKNSQFEALTKTLFFALRRKLKRVVGLVIWSLELEKGLFFWGRGGGGRFLEGDAKKVGFWRKKKEWKPGLLRTSKEP